MSLIPAVRRPIVGWITRLIIASFLHIGHATVTRGESRRDVQLADMILIDLENKAPRPSESVPCMIMAMRQGKQNQHGKLEYMGCLRNVEPIVCPLSALAFYFFYRWGRDGAT